MEKKEKENIMEKGNCFRRTGRVDIEGSLRGSRGPKNTIIDGGKTALNTAFTVDTVNTADTVCTVDTVNSVDTFYTVDIPHH